jgi:hypothetical protein
MILIKIISTYSHLKSLFYYFECKLTPCMFHASSQSGPKIPVSGLRAKTFPSELKLPPINSTEMKGNEEH